MLLLARQVFAIFRPVHQPDAARVAEHLPKLLREMRGNRREH